MKTYRKVRGDSVLKTLPAKQQRALFDQLNQLGGTIDAVRERLARRGVKTSKQAISEFYDWYCRRERGSRPPSALQFDELLSKVNACLRLLEQIAPKRSIRKRAKAIAEFNPATERLPGGGEQAA
jgi:hypothetical protein